MRSILLLRMLCRSVLMLRMLRGLLWRLLHLNLYWDLRRRRPLCGPLLCLRRLLLLLPLRLVLPWGLWGPSL